MICRQSLFFILSCNLSIYSFLLGTTAGAETESGGGTPVKGSAPPSSNESTVTNPAMGQMYPFSQGINVHFYHYTSHKLLLSYYNHHLSIGQTI